MPLSNPWQKRNNIKSGKSNKRSKNIKSSKRSKSNKKSKNIKSSKRSKNIQNNKELPGAASFREFSAAGKRAMSLGERNAGAGIGKNQRGRSIQQKEQDKQGIKSITESSGKPEPQLF